MKSSNISEITKRLRQKYPNATYELNWKTPEQLLVATILAAQCTDERVNKVTETLFRKYPTVQAFADADLAELEEDVRPTGYFRNKAKAVKGMCTDLVERFAGRVPQTVDELVTLPGVGRKTANVLLNVAFNMPSGVIVDSHVNRLSQRLGLSKNTNGDRIEADLMAQVPQSDWTFFGPAIVLHGRYTCTAQAPQCTECLLEDLCPKIGVEENPSMNAKTSPPKAAKSAKQQTMSFDEEPQTKPAPKSSAKAAPAVDVPLPESWQHALADELSKPYFAQLQNYVAEERAHHQVFPPVDEVFSAFQFTPYDQVKVLLLGQDPYHDDGQAHGLCFSVKPGVATPPSLKNMFKELEKDLGCTVPNNGCLTPWAKQGILLLNTVLTVRAHQPNSHKAQGWETFTDAVIRSVSDKPDPVVFVLWGNPARKKAKLIDSSRHTILEAAHPSPLSVAKFWGSRPFSQINAALKKSGKSEINWQLPNLP